jgi:hypothetical protein
VVPVVQHVVDKQYLRMRLNIYLNMVAQAAVLVDHHVADKLILKLLFQTMVDLNHGKRNHTILKPHLGMDSRQFQQAVLLALKDVQDKRTHKHTAQAAVVRVAVVDNNHSTTTTHLTHPRHQQIQ